MPRQPVCWWMASLTLLTTRIASASDCCPMSTATRQSKTPAGTSAKVRLTHSRRARLMSCTFCLAVLTISCLYVNQVCTCTMWEGRCTQSALVTPAFLSRAVTVITTTASTPPLSARSPVDVVSRFSTTRSLLSFWPSQSTMALRPFMSLLRCAPSE